jgi:hypothetical protein
MVAHHHGACYRSESMLSVMARRTSIPGRFAIDATTPIDFTGLSGD